MTGGLVLAFAVSSAVTVALGPVFIPLLKRLKFGQSIRGDGPARHLNKAGTPTMGGVLFIAGTLAAGALFLERGTTDGMAVLAVMLGYGFIGFLDDYIKVVHKRSLGLRAREKLLGQVILAAFLAFWVMGSAGRGTELAVPFSGYWVPGGVYLNLGPVLYTIFAVAVVVGTANAVNLTDGLDGLAAGVSMLASLALAVAALAAGRTGVALVMAATAGGCLGFLRYNRYPAKVFMGDTGSMALGGGLAAAAVITGKELFLPILGGVFVLEALSVIIQVISFQTTGRRVFRMSPLHHHFELAGWSEVKVVFVFWLLSFAFALAGLLAMCRL